MTLFHKLDCRQGIVYLASTGIVSPFTEPDAAEVEAQDLAAQPKKGFGCSKHNFVVHGTLKQRVRVADDCKGDRGRVVSELQEAFQTPGGARNRNGLNLIHVTF
jgi:hypothetical protein